MKKTEQCPHCGQNMKPRWESLNRGLIRTLAIFAGAVARSGRNAILVNKLDEMNHNQKSNFQKLRYHGLVAMNDDKDGTWRLTLDGHRFLSGDLRVPKKTLVFDNRILERSQETTCMGEAINEDDVPYWQKREDYINAMDRFFSADRRDLFDAV